MIFLNDQNQARPVFSVLEVVFVQTGHDHCVITLIAHRTDHNLYCLEMFLGPTLTINNREFADDTVWWTDCQEYRGYMVTRMTMR